MSAIPLRAIQTPSRTPTDSLAMELEAICRADGYRAAYIAAHDALKRVAEARRAELTAEGWII